MVSAIILASDRVTDSWNIARGTYPYVNNIKSLNHSLQQQSKQTNKKTNKKVFLIVVSPKLPRNNQHLRIFMQYNAVF